MSYISDVADQIAIEVGERRIDSNRRQLFLLYAVLAVVLGRAVDRRDVHDAWVAWMAMHGEDHASMLPFDALSPAIQAEDEPFAEAIRRVASRLSGAHPGPSRDRDGRVSPDRIERSSDRPA